MASPLPKRLTEAVGDFNATDNLKLLLDRYITIGRGPDYAGFKSEQGGENFAAVANRAANLKEAEWFKECKKRWLDILIQLRLVKKVKAFEAETAWRLALGLGNETTLENSLTLHPVWGVPYIPGSALKGCARSHLLEELAENTEMNAGALDELIAELPLDDEGKPLPREKAIDENPNCARIPEEAWPKVCEAACWFGTRSREGDLVFHDAMPMVFPPLKVDIINAHYGKYYQDGEVPGDWHDPNPVKFLTVDKGARFIIALGAVSDEVPEAAVQLLQKTLAEHGVGAKTAVNYGYFKIIPGDPLQAALEQAENERRAREEKAAREKEQQRLDAMLPVDRLVAQIDGAATDEQLYALFATAKQETSLTTMDKKKVAVAFKRKWEPKKKWKTSGGGVSQKHCDKVKLLKEWLGEKS